MTSALYLTSQSPSFTKVLGTAGAYMHTGMGAFVTHRLPSDPIGTAQVTFSGVNAGSEIRVYLPDGTPLAGEESCLANQVLTWSVYAPGVNSTVYITILLRGYKWQRFNYTPVVGSQTLPIFQITDLGYSNPV